MRRLAILLITVALAAQAAAAPPPQRTKTVVVGIQGRRGVDQDLARALSDVVQSVLNEDKSRVVLGRDDIAQVVALEAEKQAMGCTDSSCLSEVATAMDADRIVTGTLDKVGSTFLITLTEIDARRLEPVARVEATLPADEGQLIDAVRRAARDLNAKSPRVVPPGQTVAGLATGPGTLVVTSTPPGAQIEVDGRVVGTTPATVASLSSGNHALTMRPVGTPAIDIVAPVYAAGQTSIDVKIATAASSTPEALADLDAQRTWNNIWGWSKVGGGSVCLVASCLPFCIGCGAAIPPPDIFTAAAFLGLGTLFFVPGAGLTTWGVLDLLNPPGPGEDGPVNQVVVTPPAGSGDARTFDVPFVTEMKR